MRKLIAIADSTEVNAFVIDVKDEFGLNIPSQEPLLQKNAGNAGVIPNVRQLLDTLLALGFRPLANPLLRRTVARSVTVGQACRQLGLDTEGVLAALSRPADPPPTLEHDSRDCCHH